MLVFLFEFALCRIENCSWIIKEECTREAFYNLKRIKDEPLILKLFRNSYPVVFIGRGVRKLWNKFTREHPYRSVISIKLFWTVCFWLFLSNEDTVVKCCVVFVLALYQSRDIKKTSISWRYFIFSFMMTEKHWNKRFSYDKH